MAISNFQYDGTQLTEFNDGKYIMGYFSANETPTEGEQDLHQASLFMGKEQPFTYQAYTSTLTFTMGIIKNPCVTETRSISVSEMEDLKRWLCRPSAHKFKLIDNQYTDIFWEGTFKITEEVVGSERIGVTLTFISTRPYALQETVTFTGTVAANETVTIEDSSTEIGYIYPDMTITVLSSGNMTIVNDFENRQTIIKSCSADETLTFSKYLQVETDKSSHAIFNDFNYKFLRICNDYETNENNITFSLPCDYTISYNPIRKVIPV